MKAAILVVVLAFVCVTVGQTARARRHRTITGPEITRKMSSPKVQIFDGPAMIQPGEVFDCVVTNIENGLITVTCDAPNQDSTCNDNKDDPACVHTIMDIPAESWGEFPEWQQEPPKKGQLLKARWVDNHFVAVASCEVRTERARQQACRDAGYDCARFPANHSPVPPREFVPADCRMPRSAFILGLMDH